jgi:hypothetical protein
MSVPFVGYKCCRNAAICGTGNAIKKKDLESSAAEKMIEIEPTGLLQG